MTMRRMLAMTGGAVVPMALLALLFGNQWVVDEINKSDIRYDEGIGPVVSWLLTLAWRITPAGSLGVKQVVAEDFGLLVFFGVLVGLVLAGARLADPERGPFGALVIGWWAAVVAGGVAGIVAAPLTRWAFEFHDGSFGRTFSSTVGQGASFGFAFGWLAGLGALAGFFLARTHASGPRPRQPYAPAQPYLAPQGAPMRQQPYPQQMQPHPSAVPYVPPQGQPQQPAWGAAPVAHPPQPGQFGVPAVPPQAPAPPQEQPAPEAPEEPEGTPDGRQEGSPEEAPEGPREPAEGSEDGPEEGSEGEAPEDDDLDLDDRTMIDRKRDGA
ncbi:hypothetical protein [Actinomadura mexicana]|uniref:Uncharacterized protein n=1 Tax=Actinomadura mexicana TaxID=134959 RepID=A0A238UPB6_9ACTN|nr:hypothetical protein [Actinomadura mexicana]SNR23477.1 hypothetical protein SAMN06265355_101162 [Actinomadura mexicana]